MSADREQIIRAFLVGQGWGRAARAPLAGDASSRRYERLTGGPDGQGAVLMDAPRQTGEDTGPYLAITDHLAGLGLSAPRVLAADRKHGLLLLEDLGDALFARLLEQDPSREADLYLAATAVLVALHSAPPPDVPAYGAADMVAAASPAYDWYRFAGTGQRSGHRLASMQTDLAAAFEDLEPWKPVLILRDYHAENLFWLPDRQGPARVGLIDFQDARHSHPAYDLVSLSRDVRRDVSPATEARMVQFYCNQTGHDPDAFEQAAALLSAQRNLRILGVFARLTLHFGKAAYVNFIPRTWSNLIADLDHPALSALRARVLSDLPEPTPCLLKGLKDRCGTVPAH